MKEGNLLMSDIKIPSKKGKETSINIRMTYEERAQMEKLAEILDLPLSAFARQALIEVSKHYAERLKRDSKYAEEV
jgi:hypothetical protein